jgi:hypothetical protein
MIPAISTSLLLRYAIAFDTLLYRHTLRGDLIWAFGPDLGRQHFYYYLVHHRHDLLLAVAAARREHLQLLCIARAHGVAPRALHAAAAALYPRYFEPVRPLGVA